jgi:uncharacterized membrane protein/predicted DsbA family dithiol-disulfide isomerase
MKVDCCFGESHPVLIARRLPGVTLNWSNPPSFHIVCSTTNSLGLRGETSGLSLCGEVETGIGCEAVGMENWQRLIVIRSTSLAALALSAALLTAYLRPHALLCGYDFDCAEIWSSRYGNVFGIPLPIFGVLLFAAIFACSLSTRPGRPWLLRSLALGGCVGGLGLIVIQFFVLHRICPLCLLVDSCAVVLACAAFAWRPDACGMRSRRGRSLWMAAPIVALVLGAALGTAGSWSPAEENLPLPPQIAALHVSGKVVLVEVVDFQCPHCRYMHDVLKGLIREEGERLRLVRVVAPMAKHPQARDAARAYLCAEAQGKGAEMVELLFHAADLTPEGCESLAVALGISPEKYRAGVASAEVERRIEANLAWVMPACPQGLPCLWVQDQRLQGVQSRAALRDAIAAAELRLRQSAH